MGPYDEVNQRVELLLKQIGVHRLGGSALEQSSPKDALARRIYRKDLVRLKDPGAMSPSESKRLVVPPSTLCRLVRGSPLPHPLRSYVGEPSPLTCVLEVVGIDTATEHRFLDGFTSGLNSSYIYNAQDVVLSPCEKGY